jgi:hypothetical protein
MAISEHDEQFAGLPIRQYEAGEPIDDPGGVAHRLSVGYDEADAGETIGGLLSSFLDDPDSIRATALVIGEWESIADGGSDSSSIIEAVAAASPRLPALKAVFIGDVTYEECEISWINQTDVGPLLAAYPGLEHLRVRGGMGLEFGCERHEGLRSLIIESGGLPGEVVRQVAAADLPDLEHLELWLGTENYGGDATVADLAPILEGKRLPRLKYLGLRDCESADLVAAALAGAPILSRLETLDLSLGNLGDEGAVALLEGGKLPGLKRLDIHHHYVSDEVLDGLKALGIGLDDGDGKGGDEDEDDRYIAVSE